MRAVDPTPTGPVIDRRDMALEMLADSEAAWRAVATEALACAAGLTGCVERQRDLIRGLLDSVHVLRLRDQRCRCSERRTTGRQR